MIIAVGQTKVFVFAYRTKRLALDVRPPVRVWRRDDLAVDTDTRMVASKLTIDVRSTGYHHELESTSMTGRLGKITREIFRLLGDASIGAPPGSRSSRPPTKKQEARRRRLGELADEIEAELRSLGWWLPDPPSENTVLAGGAFGMETVPFVTWIQVIFVVRLRQAASGEFPIPSSSSVSTMAVRELDGGAQDTDRLLDLLHEVDRVVKTGV